jgi:hypothetical protein
MKAARQQRRKHAAEPSRGLGDTIAKFTRATYLNALAELYEDVLGRPCGCEERRAILNRLVPYRRSRRAVR